MDGIFLSIILPVRNEERRLPGALDLLIQFLRKEPFAFEIIVVLNASTDRSLGIVRGFARQHGEVRAIILDTPGKGGAVREGMLGAKGAYRFFADVDFSMPVEEITRFIPPALDAPIAIGSREGPGAKRYNEPIYRRITGRAFNTLIRSLVLPDLKDTQCGFKMFRADAVEDIFHHQTLTGWSFDVELLYIARLRGCPVVEIPIPWYFNAESRLSVWRDSWSMFLDLWRVRRNGLSGRYT